jgi:putative addiction module component (TIGR02574 family)
VTLMQEYGLDKLPRDRRLDLAHELWASLEDEPAASELSESHDAEVLRRLAAYDADPSRAIAWEDVEAEALRRIDE